MDRPFVNTGSKTPLVYRPTIGQTDAPPVYRPQQIGNPGVQFKPQNNFRVEPRSAPPVYRPQQPATFASPAARPPQSDNRWLQPKFQSVWVGNGRQSVGFVQQPIASNPVFQPGQAASRVTPAAPPVFRPLAPAVTQPSRLAVSSTR